MNTMTNFLKQKVLAASLGISAQTFPNEVYLAAFTTATTNAGGGTEVAGNGYARQEVKFTTPSIAGEQATTGNNALIEFPIATGNWGKVTHIALMDAATGGNMLYHGAVDAPKTIETGDQLRLLTNSLKVFQK